VALKDMDDKGQWRNLTDLDYRREFDDIWSLFSSEEQSAINDEINHRLDLGGIINTSILGGQVNPDTGIPGDWSGTPFQAIYDHLGDVDLAALFFGNIWKLRIIERPEEWIGIRNNPINRPTFPERDISLDGKTYFLARE